MQLSKLNSNNFVSDIKLILETARQKAYSAVNSAMVEGYWLAGKRIVEEEQLGEKRAAYGKKIIENLSKELSLAFKKKYSERTLREFRQFYLTFPALITNQQTALAELEIWRTVFAKLHWSHFQRVLKVADENARMYYLAEAANNNWSIKTLDRNIATLYYQRLLSSQIQEPVVNEMLENTQQFQNNTLEFIKNPAVLEFLNLPTAFAYTEAELEKALINNLQQFLLELGKGFSFVARQKHIRTETTDFFIDLVFYNYILKCFVLIELKTEKLTHQHIGQLDMYVRMFDDIEKTETDNPTIGILLCTETDSTIAKYSVLNQNQQLFATKYMDYLPTEKELVAEIEREKLIIKQQLGL
jgi:predicted nuclease of restriction endonuclease-like (RecB) superfamily